LNILNLESDVGGTPTNPIYIMEIDGAARNGVDSIRAALDSVAKGKNIKISVTPINRLMG